MMMSISNLSPERHKYVSGTTIFPVRPSFDFIIIPEVIIVLFMRNTPIFI
jgi:hypothetical protein